MTVQAFSLESSVGDLYATDIMTEVVQKRLNAKLRKNFFILSCS